MSHQSDIRRLTAVDIRARKGGQPIVLAHRLSCPYGAVVDGAADFILVGDSLGMVMHGMMNRPCR